MTIHDELYHIQKLLKELHPLVEEERKTKISNNERFLNKIVSRGTKSVIEEIKFDIERLQRRQKVKE